MLYMSDIILAIFQTEPVSGTFWENECCTAFKTSSWCTIEKVLCNGCDSFNWIITF